MTRPLPCDTSSLPKYPPSKEFDAKLRNVEARRYASIIVDHLSSHSTILWLLNFLSATFEDTAAASVALYNVLLFFTDHGRFLYSTFEFELQAKSRGSHGTRT